MDLKQMSDGALAALYAATVAQHESGMGECEEELALVQGEIDERAERRENGGLPDGG